MCFPFPTPFLRYGGTQQSQQRQPLPPGKYNVRVREHLTGKNVLFQALPKLPLPLSHQFGQIVQLFLDVKNDVSHVLQN